MNQNQVNQKSDTLNFRTQQDFAKLVCDLTDVFEYAIQKNAKEQDDLVDSFKKTYFDSMIALRQLATYEHSY